MARFKIHSVADLRARARRTGAQIQKRFGNGAGLAHTSLSRAESVR